MSQTLPLQKTLAIVPKPGALLSFVSSIFVVYSIIKSPSRRQRVYHRLVLVTMILNGTSSRISFLFMIAQRQQFESLI